MTKQFALLFHEFSESNDLIILGIFLMACDLLDRLKD